MAPAVPKERGKPGQLSDLPENSPRHTARFTVPRNDKKMKLWGGQRTGDRPFQPTARFFQAGGPPCRRLWPCSRGQAHPAVPSLKKKPVRHRLGKAALSQICAFFAESTVCLCSPQRRALGGWGGGGRGEPGSGASPHGTPAASARAPAPRGPPRARTRGTTVSPRRPGHGGLAAWGPPPPGPVRRGVVRVRAGPVRPHLRSGSWPGPAGGAPGWRRRRRSAPPPGSPAARGGAGTARAAAPRPPPPRRTRAPGRSSPAAAARGRAGGRGSNLPPSPAVGWQPAAAEQRRARTARPAHPVTCACAAGREAHFPAARKRRRARRGRGCGSRCWAATPTTTSARPSWTCSAVSGAAGAGRGQLRSAGPGGPRAAAVAGRERGKALRRPPAPPLSCPRERVPARCEPPSPRRAVVFPPPGSAEQAVTLAVRMRPAGPARPAPLGARRGRDLPWGAGGGAGPVRREARSLPRHGCWNVGAGAARAWPGNAVRAGVRSWGG